MPRSPQWSGHPSCSAALAPTCLAPKASNAAVKRARQPAASTAAKLMQRSACKGAHPRGRQTSVSLYRYVTTPCEHSDDFFCYCARCPSEYLREDRCMGPPGHCLLLSTCRPSWHQRRFSSLRSRVDATGGLYKSLALRVREGLGSARPPSASEAWRATWPSRPQRKQSQATHTDDYRTTTRLLHDGARRI